MLLFIDSNESINSNSGGITTLRQNKNDRLDYEYAGGNRRTEYIQQRNDKNKSHSMHEDISFHHAKWHTSIRFYNYNISSRTVHR